MTPNNFTIWLKCMYQCYISENIVCICSYQSYVLISLYVSENQFASVYQCNCPYQFTYNNVTIVSEYQFLLVIKINIESEYVELINDMLETILACMRCVYVSENKKNSVKHYQYSTNINIQSSYFQFQKAEKSQPNTISIHQYQYPIILFSSPLISAKIGTVKHAWGLKKELRIKTRVKANQIFQKSENTI